MANQILIGLEPTNVKSLFMFELSRPQPGRSVTDAYWLPKHANTGVPPI